MTENGGKIKVERSSNSLLIIIVDVSSRKAETASADRRCGSTRAATPKAHTYVITHRPIAT